MDGWPWDVRKGENQDKRPWDGGRRPEGSRMGDEMTEVGQGEICFKLE